MARAVLNTTLIEFKSVVKEMRELGVATWVGSPVGDIHLGAPPPTRSQKATEIDPKAGRREHYSVLFNRPVTDSELEKLP